MNKLLIGNGLLLVAFIGFQQWLICYSNPALEIPIDVFGRTTFLNTQISEVAINLPSIFAVLSLALPFYMVKQKKFFLSNKAEKLAVWVVPPLLFFSIAHLCDCLPHPWNVTELAGPQSIQHSLFSPQI